MIFHRRKGWEISENETTPEAAFFSRRAFMGKAGLAMAGTALAGTALSGALPGLGFPSDASALTLGNMIAADLYPAKRNAVYKGGRDQTPENVTSVYNNFYEFGSHKRISKAAQALQLEPWDIMIDGEVEKPMKIGIEDLIKKMKLEERIYRHRCVEAWAMTVPWTGFPARDLVKLAAPKSSAGYVVMETFLNKSVAPGQKQVWYPWPYVEGITMKEAMNDLAFFVTGIYGHPLQKQFGAPLRLALPWKYGFKSIKSITRISFSAKRPVSFWEKINAREYGFWANVNPEVPHPRWSQATEELLGEGRRVPTRRFNGYGEFIADLYDGLEGERLWG